MAKSAGALWDKATKSWYAGPDADMSKLERWKPDNVADQQGPAITPEEEFDEVLKSLGCIVTGKHPIMDGKKHRIGVDGDKKGEEADSMSATWMAILPGTSRIIVPASI
jgi:putative DNA primase/helicase